MSRAVIPHLHIRFYDSAIGMEWCVSRKTAVFRGFYIQRETSRQLNRLMLLHMLLGDIGEVSMRDGRRRLTICERII